MIVSIVIPTKNEEQRLPVLLQALQNQEGIELEVIVADAHSTDQTAASARAFGAEVVEGGMPGPGRNAGAKHATGEWICFHDADVLPQGTDFYARALAIFVEEKADFGTARMVPDGNRRRDRLWHWLYHLYVWATARFFPHAPGGCIFVKRALHERVGGFDETVVFAEDMEYVQRLKKAGGKFAYLADIPLEMSVRRLRKEGYLGIAWKYIVAEVYMRFVGPIRKEIFTYEFGYAKEAKGE